MAPFARSRTSSYLCSIVTVAVSCTVFEIKRDIGRKRQCFTPYSYLTCRIFYNPTEFLPKILIQTIRVRELLCSTVILPKSSSPAYGAITLQMTDGRLMP